MKLLFVFILFFNSDTIHFTAVWHQNKRAKFDIEIKDSVLSIDGQQIPIEPIKKIVDSDKCTRWYSYSEKYKTEITVFYWKIQHSYSLFLDRNNKELQYHGEYVCGCNCAN